MSLFCLLFGGFLRPLLLNLRPDFLRRRVQPKLVYDLPNGRDACHTLGGFSVF